MISGTGFEPGARVTIAGVDLQVDEVGPTRIRATVPSMPGSSGGPAEVVVRQGLGVLRLAEAVKLLRE